MNIKTSIILNIDCDVSKEFKCSAINPLGWSIEKIEYIL